MLSVLLGIVEPWNASRANHGRFLNTVRSSQHPYMVDTVPSQQGRLGFGVMENLETEG